MKPATLQASWMVEKSIIEKSVIETIVNPNPEYVHFMIGKDGFRKENDVENKKRI